MNTAWIPKFDTLLSRKVEDTRDELMNVIKHYRHLNTRRSVLQCTGKSVSITTEAINKMMDKWEHQHLFR